jgi:hypothetical protein
MLREGKLWYLCSIVGVVWSAQVLANPPLSMSAVDMVILEGETVIDTAFGASTLIRDNKGATGTVNLGDLDPGVVHSVWALAFNSPEACEATPCLPGTDGATADLSVFWVSGGISGGYGELNLSFRIERGRPAGFVNPSLLLDGLTNVEGAEIHFVVAPHAGAVAGTVAHEMTHPAAATRGAVHLP